MLHDAVGFSEIYIVCGRTDLRYGIDSLAAVLRSLGIENPATAGTLINLLSPFLLNLLI